VNQTARSRELGRVVSAGVIGTAVEFYDFFLYGAAAALVFGKVFFPHAAGLLGVLAALATYAVGFAARPLGGVVFGHFGDRIGRKRLLVISLLLMGGSSVLIGLLPSYHQIGVAAPTLLVLLRLVQGFALGGEFGGAVLLVAEHGPANRRGFWASWPQTGGPLGNLLATGTLAMTAAITTSADYLVWGWRVPFVASIALVIIGLWIRARVSESPLFTEIVKHQDRQRAPLVAALRHPRPLFSVFAARIGENATFYVFTIFLLVYASHIGLTRAMATQVVAIASVVQIASMLAGGALSDRLGRRPVAIVAALAAAGWAWAFFPLMDTKNFSSVLLALAIGFGLHGILTGAQAAFYAELFDTTIRYSGVSLGYQAATVFAGAAAPLVGTEILRQTGSPALLIVLLDACLLLTVFGMALAPETRHSRLR
jgi:MFS family permease